MANTPLRQVRVDDDLWKRFGEVLKPGDTRSQVIRELIENYIYLREQDA